MSTIPWTADQLTQGIAKAIEVHDFEAVADLLRILTTVDPHRAETILATINRAAS